MKTIGIIPARYGSSRLEGKPLKDIEGKTMIRRVYDQCKKALETVIVATDDERIFQEVLSFGGEAVMTDKNHSTGTNRCLEALDFIQAKNDIQFDVVINIQGDEPLLHPNQIEKISSCFLDESVELASLAMPVPANTNLQDHNGCFVVLNQKSDALYFSRSIIPFLRDYPIEEWSIHHQYYFHIGMYAYTPKALRKFAHLDQTSLEKAESLEQNRWLQSGGEIRLGLSEHETIAVDTQSDLNRVRKIIREQNA